MFSRHFNNPKGSLYFASVEAVYCSPFCFAWTWPLFVVISTKFSNWWTTPSRCLTEPPPRSSGCVGVEWSLGWENRQPRARLCGWRHGVAWNAAITLLRLPDAFYIADVYVWRAATPSLVICMSDEKLTLLLFIYIYYFPEITPKTSKIYVQRPHVYPWVVKLTNRFT